MFEKLSSQTPFSKELEEKNYLPRKLKGFEGRGDLVVREISLDDVLLDQYLEDPEAKPMPDYTNKEAVHALLSKEYGNDLEKKRLKAVEVLKNAYKELETKYGLSVPAEFVVGESDSGRPALYIIVDRVIGTPLDRIPHTTENAEELEARIEVYDKLIQYYNDKIDTRDYYLADIHKAGQFTYGVTAKDIERKAYLLDVDTQIKHKNEKHFALMLYVLSQELTDFEQEYALNLTDQKNKLATLVQKARNELRNTPHDWLSYYDDAADLLDS